MTSNPNEPFDPKVKSFGPFSKEDIKKCVSRGVIPKEIYEVFLEDLEISLDIRKTLKERRGKGAKLTPKEISQAYKKHETTGMLKNRLQRTNEFVDFVIENKGKILSIINEAESGTFRVSRDITDNKFPKPNSKQLYPFKTDELSIEKNNLVDSTIKLPYLDLSEAEDKVVLVLCQLLAKKSERLNQKSSDYYMGNAGTGCVTLEGMEMETARITITPHEFYKTYLGRNNYGSTNSRHLWETIIALAKKQFLIFVSFPRRNLKKGEKKYDTLRTFLPLFELGILNPDQSERESVGLRDSKEVLEGKGCQLIFKFNPIFTLTIRERYIEYPENMHLRIGQTSSGGRKGKTPQCVNLMRDLLFREKQLKRYRIERNENTLIRDLGLEKELNAGRKKRVQERLKRNLDIFKELGLIKKTEKTTGALGQVKYIIHINKNFK